MTEPPGPDRLYLYSMKIESRNVASSTTLCENNPALDELLALMLEHLKRQGYVSNSTGYPTLDVAWITGQSLTVN